jgi:hypothetical protein
MNIYTKEGMEQLEQKLDGIVLNAMTGSTSEVADKDLPKVMEVVYVNAPTTIDEAIARILELEMRLEDLSRATEIASMTGQYNILDGFRGSADESLKLKIVIEQPDFGDLKLTVITNNAKAQ